MPTAERTQAFSGCNMMERPRYFTPAINNVSHHMSQDVKPGMVHTLASVTVMTHILFHTLAHVTVHSSS